MKIAYFINQYPKVSHTFIRREILELERQGAKILRVALRGWDADLVDSADIEEREKTQYILKNGLVALIFRSFCVMLSSPVRFLSALALALRMSQHADRPLPYHLFYLAEACWLAKLAKQYGAQHIHAHFGINSAEIAMLANALGSPPFSFTAHGSEVTDKAEFLGIDEKIRRSSFTIAVCSYGKSQLLRRVAHPYWSKIHVIRCGLDRSYYNESPAVPLQGNRRLICVARLSEEKGHTLLLEAAGILARKGVDFELVLAGDGELRQDLEKMIERLSLTGKVRITGWINERRVREEVLASRGLVLPSFAEGLPVVIIEAMALRRPVLSTYVGGIPELVRPGENGWLVPAGSSESLSAAIEEFLSAPIDQLEHFGNAGYSRATSEHCIESEAAKLLALFRESARITFHH